MSSLLSLFSYLLLSLSSFFSLFRAHPKPTINPWQNAQFGSQIKNAKNMGKTIPQECYIRSLQKTAWKNTKYSRNETILKIGHLKEAIAHAKAIDLFHNGGQIKYSFVLMLISPPSLVTTSKFQKNICFKTRAVGLINIKTKEFKSGRHLWKWAMGLKVIANDDNDFCHAFYSSGSGSDL